VVRIRNERDTWLGRAVDAVLTEREQRVLTEAGGLMERLASFELPETYPEAMLPEKTEVL
jgi:hypothetical protein